MEVASYEDLLQHIVEPQRAQLLPTKLPSCVETLFSITGSKGKTSTAMELSRILPFASRFISPHCFSLRERIGKGNALLSPASFQNLFDRTDLGFFGNLQNAHMNFLDSEQVSVSICEAGIGGLMDSTNVPFAGRKIGILTSTELEHCSLLGHSIKDILYEKMGYFDGASKVIVPEELDLRGFDRFYGLEDRIVRVPEHADKQTENAALARRAALEAGISPIPKETERLVLPGRGRLLSVENGRVIAQTPRADAALFPQLSAPVGQSSVGSLFFVDSAHTSESVKFALSQCAKIFDRDEVTLVFSETKRERAYKSFINSICEALNIGKKLYLPASSSSDFAYGTTEDPESLSIGDELIENCGFEMLPEDGLRKLKGRVLVIGSEHGACLAEWLLFKH